MGQFLPLLLLHIAFVTKTRADFSPTLKSNAMQTSDLKSKSFFRMTGALYLVVIICAGLSQGYVRGSLVISGDAAATAANIGLHESLFRLGLSLDLVAFVVDAIISVMLYQIFKPYGKTLALASAALRLVAHPAIGSLNLINHFMAYQILSGAEYLRVFDPPQLEALSLFFMEAHRYGYLIAGAFFGLHLLLLGIQIYRSDLLPKIFGGLMLGAAAGYLLETFGNFSLPGNEAWLALVVGISAALGEVGLALYLIIRGTKKQNFQPKEALAS
jgi:hypothetical protein